MGEIKDKLAALEAEINKLKAAATPTSYDSAAEAAWRDAMHQASEARMSRAPGFSRADLEDMERACPTSTVRGIVRDNRAPQGRPPVIPINHQTSNVGTDDRRPVNTTGWAHEAPLGPPPGVAQADRLMDAADRRDREALLLQEAQRQALLKAGQPE